MMRERDVLLAVHEIEGVDWETIQNIADAFPDLTALLDKPAAARIAGAGVPAELAARIDALLTNESIAGKLRFYESRGIATITFFDAAYPPWLRYMYRPPWVLYAQGDLELLQRASVAVVGSRHPTAYGREVAGWFGAELAAAGVPVVSGLARGVDSYAHAGALKTTGATIAVLGNGLNVVYPPEHHALQRAIASKGVVVTEYAWNAAPSKLTFPWRNRIIAGIACATLVVEAAERSGSLQTADYALKHGRDVFGVPGHITSAKSAGVYGLIRDGAKLALSPVELLEEIGQRPGKSSAPAHAIDTSGLTPEEAELVAVMGGEAMPIDEMIARTGHSFGHLHTVLLSLLVKNRIRALPGSQYIVTVN